MAWSKRDIIQQALTEIGLADYAFDLEPAQWQSALRRLDAMIGQWEMKGIRLAYPMPISYANSSLDQSIDGHDTALEALYLNLAVRLAPQYGKTPSPDTKITGFQAYKTLLAMSAQPVELQINNNGIPAGAGYKWYGDPSYPFLRPPVDGLAAGDDSDIDGITL
jgi:hypothetical protein